MDNKETARCLMGELPGWLCWYGTFTHAWWALPPPRGARTARRGVAAPGRGIHRDESPTKPIRADEDASAVTTTPTLHADPPIPTGALCWRRAFPGRPDQAAPARRFTACLLAGCPHTDDAVQAVAELCANAIQHTLSAAPGGLFVVDVRRWRGGAAVSITDQGGPTEPHVPDLDPHAGYGLGLHLIAATATWWGWRGDATGRTVTALFI
jgi:hypothetical protein